MTNETALGPRLFVEELPIETAPQTFRTILPSSRARGDASWDTTRRPLLVDDQEVAHLGKIPVMLREVSETATWTAPDEGERLWFLGTLATIKVPGEASHGASR
jgi:hypothetical protein